MRSHRWIMEQHLGRKLRAREHVHHRNGNPLDNRLSNLVVLDQNAHLRLHKQIYPDLKICARCGASFTVNPRKRRRNKCCSSRCAQTMRVVAAVAARRRKARR